MKEIPLPPRPESPRILIVKLSAVGDVVHALPVLNALRTAFPRAHLGWAVHPGASNLLEGHPQLDELIVLPRRKLFSRGWKPLREKVAELRGGGRGRWDWAIDIQGLTKSGLVAALSGARRRIGFAGPDSRELNALFMTDRVRFTRSHVVSNNLALLAPLGIGRPGPARAVLHVTDEDRAVIAQWARREGVEGERFLVIDAFAGWPTKLWDHARWAEVMARMERERGIRPLVFFGPGERRHAEELAARAAGRGARPVLAPDTTLRQYIALLEAHAAAFAGGDTGPMHIAAAGGVPTVALYGPSDSKRCVPAFEGARYVTLQDFSQPCAATGARRCPHHPQPGQCLAALTSDAVLEALGQVME